MTRANVELATDDPENPIYYFYQLINIVALDGYAFDPKKFADEEYVKKLFNAHIEEVKRVVPADQLLVLELGEGWDRLCHFLGKEVPDVPYPSVNSTAEFVEFFIEQIKVDNTRRAEKTSA